MPSTKPTSVPTPYQENQLKYVCGNVVNIIYHIIMPVASILFALGISCGFVFGIITLIKYATSSPETFGALFGLVVVVSGLRYALYEPPVKSISCQM